MVDVSDYDYGLLRAFRVITVLKRSEYVTSVSEKLKQINDGQKVETK